MKRRFDRRIRDTCLDKLHLDINHSGMEELGPVYGLPFLSVHLFFSLGLLPKTAQKTRSKNAGIGWHINF